jgi:hypothetical protein
MVKAGFTSESKEKDDFELMPLEVIFKDLYDTKQKEGVEKIAIKSEVKDEGKGGKEEKKDQFYDEQDSDNESDFEVQYM